MERLGTIWNDLGTKKSVFLNIILIFLYTYIFFGMMERLLQYKERKKRKKRKKTKWSSCKSRNIVPSLMPDFDIRPGKQMENGFWNDFPFGTVLFLNCLRGTGRSSIFQENRWIRVAENARQGPVTVEPLPGYEYLST